MSIFKKIKKVAKKSAETVKDTADKGADTVKKTVEKGAEEVAGGVSKSFDQMLGEAKNAYNTVKKETMHGLDEAKKLLLKNKAMAAYNYYKEPVTALAKSGKSLVGSDTGKRLLPVLKTQVKARKVNEPTRVTVSQLTAAPEMAPAVQSAREKSFLSISYMYGGDASYLLGGEGNIGYAVGVLNSNEIIGIASLGGVAGISVGGSIDAMMAIWRRKPSKLKGGYVAVELEAGDVVGAGVQVILEAPSFELVGFVVIVGAGIEAQFAVTGGYTWTFS
jgi:hypothetical protein